MRDVLLVALVAVVLTTSTAGAAPPLADRLPADASTYVGWAGRNLAFDGSMLGGVLNHPRTAQIAKAIRQATASHLETDRQRQIADSVWEMLSIAWQHPIALCVLDIPEVLDCQTPPVPRAALLIELGKDRPAFDEHLSTLLKALGADITVGDAIVGDATFKTVRIDPAWPVLTVGYLGDLVFVAVGADVPARLIAVADAADKSLLNAPKFTAAYKDVAGPDEQYAEYIDVPAVADMVERIAAAQRQPIPPSVSNVIEALGLAKVTSIAGAARIVDRGLYSKTRIVTPAPHQGVLMPLAGAPLTVESLSFVPADADLVITARLDPTAALAEVQRVVAAINPSMGGQMTGGLAQMGELFGFSLKDDLLAHMGDQWTLVSAPSLGGPLTGTALVVNLKDEAAFKAALAKIEMLARAMMTPQTRPGDATDSPGQPSWQAPNLATVSVGDTDITYVRISTDFIPIAPAWAAHDGKLIIAPWPQVIESLIAGVGASPLPTEPNFQAATGQVTRQPTVLAYFNLPKIIRQQYLGALVLWTGAANSVCKEGLIDARPDWLPSLHAFEKSLWPRIEAVSADEGAITIESYGSMPIAHAALGLSSPTAIAGLGFALPTLGRARALARESLSQSQLRAIGTAIEMYKGSHEQTPPPDLQALVNGKFIGAKALISPQSVHGRDAYIYIHLPRGAPNHLIRVYEDPKTHGQPQTPVLFAGSYVQLMPVNQEFWDLIRQSKAAAIKAE